MSKNKLQPYSRKRDFSKTPEPAAESLKDSSQKPIFVVQKHFTKRLHYDFRLECDGVLKSWAIPKGPSLNPAHKRLAIATEDHPLSYADFEGKIPDGQYGAGEVIVWDIGSYRNIKSDSVLADYKRDHLEITLSGYKLKGNFALICIGPKKGNWLLIKMKDKYADTKTDILKKSGSVLKR
jgi:DNA ligase D-like protein (predicted 3'-phosphoesterase)